MLTEKVDARKFIASAYSENATISLMGARGNFVADLTWMMPDGEYGFCTEPIWYNYLESRAFEDEFILKSGNGWKLEAEVNEISVDLRLTVEGGIAGKESVVLSLANHLLSNALD